MHRRKFRLALITVALFVTMSANAGEPRVSDLKVGDPLTPWDENQVEPAVKRFLADCIPTLPGTDKEQGCLIQGLKLNVTKNNPKTGDTNRALIADAMEQFGRIYRGAFSSTPS